MYIYVYILLSISFLNNYSNLCCNWLFCSVSLDCYKYYEIMNDNRNQGRFGISAWFCNPHVFPAASLICPCSPQPVPHEFLTIQTPSAWYPIATTAWFRFVVPQLLKTPDL